MLIQSYLHLGLPSGFFLSDFPTKTLYAPLLSPIHATYPAYLIFLDSITRINFGEQYRSLSSSLCSFLHSPVTSSPLRPKYSSQYPILEHSWPKFLPRYERPSFTPIQNKSQSYVSVCLNFYIFGL